MDNGKAKVVYIGSDLTGYYGLRRLQLGLLKDQISVPLTVVPYNDRIRASHLQNLSESSGIKTLALPINSREMQELITESHPDMAIVMNFNQKIGQDIIDLFPMGIWNVHPSDLPKYRGGAPLEYMIVDNQPLVITVHKLTHRYDKGPILYKSNPIDLWEMDIDEVNHLSARQSALAMEKSILQLMGGNYSLRIQNEDEATYANYSGLEAKLSINWAIDFGYNIHRKILAAGKRRGAKARIELNGLLQDVRIVEGNFFPDNIQPKEHLPFNGKVLTVYDEDYLTKVQGGLLYFRVGNQTTSVYSDSQTENHAPHVT
jgi:methionyl-tRNA formyltransferase